MKIAEYNQMMAYLTRPEPLPQPKPEELLDLQEQKRKDRLRKTMEEIGPGLMDESVDFIEREEFSQGTDSALKFGKKQSIFSPQSFQKILSASGQKIQPQAYKIILEALKKAGIEYTPPSSPGKAGSFNNVTEKTIELFNKETTKLKAEAGLPMSRYQTEKIKKDIKIFVKDKIKKSEYVSRPVIKDQFGIEGKSADALITRSLGINEKAGTGLLKKLGKEEAKAASIETGTKAAQAKLKDADEVLKDINNEFKLDPDISSSEDMAKKIYGSDFKKADLKGKEALVRQTDNDIVTYLKVIRGGREKPKGIKLPNQETINDIVDNIELGLADETAEGKSQFKKKGFRFSPGILRGYKFSLIDEALGLKPGTFVSERNKFLVKGKELDEIFGLSSMSRNAPGYAEAVQVLSKKVNKRKRKEIDQPMSRIVDALNNNRTTMTYKGEDNVPVSKAVKDFNKKSAAFAKKYNIRGPKINLGGNFNLNNYDNFRPESKKNIEQVFKNKNYFLSEVNNKPFETITSKSFPNQGQKKLTAFEELIKRQGSGVDPSLLMKAGFEEFVKPTGKFAGQVARGVGTAADLAISAGKGGTGLALGALLEADPIITGMSEGKDFGQTARDTFVGMALDAIPGVNLGSLNEDLIKLADTEEQRVAIQNLIDYQKDYERFNKDLNAFKSYKDLDQISLDELGFTASDLVNMESSLAKRFEDIQTRAPKVYNPDVFLLARELATKEAMKRKENLEGVQGLIFGDRMAKDPNFIENQIQQIMAASTGAQGATDSYADNYRFLPQEQLTSDELDERFNMEGGIMAANGGRIGFADGPMDPKRRTFMKIMAGIASLPIFSKFIGKSEVAKPIVKIAGSSTKMPDWFPDLINKAMFSGTGKKIDADIMKYEVKELPGIEIYRHDDGRVFVSGKNEYGKTYEIEYEPPGYELIDETTGKAVKRKGEFIAQEEVPVNVDPDGNADFDVDVLEDLDQILGPDTRAMEEFATGKKIKDMKSGEFQVGKAEADADRAIEEAAELDEID